MTRRKATTDDAPRELQRQLPFSREERLAAIDALSREQLACTSVQLNRLKGLLTNLEFLTQHMGCFPRQKSIAMRMGVDRCTVNRLVQLAVDKGLLTTETYTVEGVGKRGLNYFIDWTKITALAAPEKCYIAPKNATSGAENATSPPENVTTRCSNMSHRDVAVVSHPIENALVRIRNTSSSSDSSKAASPIAVTDAEWQQLEEEVFKLGVDQAEPAIAAAVTAGCTASHLQAIIASHQKRQLGPGALFKRLITARPADDPERGWPAAPPAKPKPADREREFAHAAAENVRLDRWKAGWNIIKRLRGQQIPDDEIAAQLPQFGFTREELEF